MTDDEIISELAKLLRLDGCVSRVGAYRAGMREAARIARERKLPSAAAAIERAAGGEG